MVGVTHVYTTSTTAPFARIAHVGARLSPNDREAREVYNIEYYAPGVLGKGKRGQVAVSDMLDEGSWFQPTIERVWATNKTYKRIIARLVVKYERRLRKE